MKEEHDEDDDHDGDRKLNVVGQSLSQTSRLGNSNEA